jgi:hypothetical protein
LYLVRTGSFATSVYTWARRQEAQTCISFGLIDGGSNPLNGLRERRCCDARPCSTAARLSAADSLESGGWRSDAGPRMRQVWRMECAWAEPSAAAGLGLLERLGFGRLEGCALDLRLDCGCTTAAASCLGDASSLLIPLGDGMDNVTWGLEGEAGRAGDAAGGTAGSSNLATPRTPTWGVFGSD